jgi:hypothetical protein
MFQIIDREQDAADKCRIRVAIAGQTVTFKFQSEPTDEEVQAAAARYAAMIAAQETMAAEVMTDAAANTD